MCGAVKWRNAGLSMDYNAKVSSKQCMSEKGEKHKIMDGREKSVC
jgi:hypothetical protein